MKASRAVGMAARAMRTRGDGSRGLRARWAWRRLSRAGDAGDHTAADAVWQAWLAAPDDELLWAALSRWRELRSLAGAAFAAAVQPERDPASRAAIGASCARHGLAPADEADRALFYLLTGQPAQHRAADPDGSRLALAYQAAAEPTRAALRTAMAEAGDIDLARVLGTRFTARAAGLSAAEAGYLIRQLTARRDWAGLWRIARDLPLLSALETMRHLRGTWRPPDGPQARLFDRLAAADPVMITAARDELTAPAVVEIESRYPPTGATFSPDGRHLVMLMRHGRRYKVLVYRLPIRVPVQRYRDRDHGKMSYPLLHTGEALFAVRSRPRPGAVYGEQQWELVTIGAGQVTVIEKLSWATPLVPVPGGFAMWALGRTLQVRTAQGELVHGVKFGKSPWTHWNAVHPQSGRLAVALGSTLRIFDAASADVLSTGTLPKGLGFHSRCFFLGPDHVAAIGTDNGEATVYRLDGDTLRVTARTRLSPAWPWARLAVQLGDEIAVVDGEEHLVRFVGGETLTETRPPRRFSVSGPVGLWASADGRSYMLSGYRPSHAALAEVVWGGDPAVRALAERPLAATSLADLATVRTALRGPVPGAAARPFLELMRDVLEQRFGTEVAIGSGRPVPAADDIALSRRGSWTAGS